MTDAGNQVRAVLSRCARAGALAVALIAGGTQWAAAGPGVVLAPHRAVYDLSLASSSSSSSVVGVRGRMVHEFTGGPCQGYNVSMRWVAQMADEDGDVNLDDVRFISWEKGDGDAYSFTSTRYQNDQLIEEVKASAKRGEAGGEVSLLKPDQESLSLPAGTIFPTAHLSRVIEAARAGARFAQERVYDVSEDGKKIYATLAIVTPLRHDSRDEGIEGVDHAAALDGMDGWRVRVSYFDGGADGEETPAFEQTFDLFANGVASDLLLDYGDIVVKGTLTKLDFLAPPGCKD